MKYKLLKCGIFGTELTNLSKEEINLCVSLPEAEFFYTKDQNLLKKDFDGKKIKKAIKYNEIIENIQHISVRIKYFVFIESLKYLKFKEDYPYNIINLFLKSEDFISTEVIRNTCNLDPKRVFYVLKRLKQHDLLIEKKEKKILMLKLKVDKIFETPNIKKESEEPPDRPLRFYRDVPFLDQIKNLIDESTIGITSNDIKSTFGIAVRQGHTYLNRIIELEPDKYGSKEIFTGKMRRYLYFLKDNLKKQEQNNIKNDFITKDDRIAVLNDILKISKSFIISEESILHFKNKLNYNFVPCKKTIMSTALQAGHKVYFLNEVGKNRTVILHKDMELQDYLNSLKKTEPNYKSKFDEKFYKIFVCYEQFIIQDNLYKIDENEKLFLWHNYLLKHSFDSYIIIDENFINNINLDLIFKVIPINIVNIINDILENNSKYEQNKNCLENISLSDAIKRNLYGENTKKMKISLNLIRIFRKILVLKKYNLIEIYCKSEDKSDFKYNNNFYKKLKIQNLFNEKNDKLKLYLNDNILFKLKEFYIKINPKQNSCYISFEDRLKLADIVSFNKKEKAYEIIKSFIKQKYENSYKSCIKILNDIFGKIITDKQKTNLDPKISEYLYTKIKYDLIKKSSLQYKDYKKYDNIDDIKLN